MLTFFTTAKPFRGHDGIIQRNALKSWTLLHPGVEVILFGDEEGAAEVCAEYGLRHEAYVERYQSKLPFANWMFARAQEIARHEYLCYSNCDIILLPDFWKALEIAAAWQKRFLMVSRRWDSKIAEAIDFQREDWAGELRRFALKHGFHQTPYFVDFLLFSKGLYAEIPPLVVGYAYWDIWMVWKALSEEVPVLDASPFLVPVHQDHAYATTERSKGSDTDATAMGNFELAGGWKHLRHAEDSTFRLSRKGRVYRSPFRYKRHAKAALNFLRFDVWNPIWFFILGITRPLRTVVGLRTGSVRRSSGEAGPGPGAKP